MGKRRLNKVRLTISDPFLKEFYNIEEGTVLKVIRKVKMKSHGNCKIKKEWIRYTVRARNHYPDNFHMQLCDIWLDDSECVPTNFKLSKI